MNKKYKISLTVEGPLDGVFAKAKAALEMLEKMAEISDKKDGIEIGGYRQEIDCDLKEVEEED